MLSKSKIKYIQSLHQKKYRQMYGYFLVEGRKSVADLLVSHFEIHTIYATNDWFIENEQISKCEVVKVDEVCLQKIATHQQPDQVIALVKTPSLDLHNKLPVGKYVVLDSINDPGNAGTIIRTADWFGWDGVVFLENSVDVFNPKTVSAAKGSLFNIPIFVCSAQKLFNSTDHHLVYGTFIDGVDFSYVEKNTNALLIIGNEANGISGDVAKHVSYKISIPKKGKAESLNAAIATAVFLSHWT